MYNQKITELLALNGIDDKLFYQKLYRTLLLGVFEVICKEMKKRGTKTAEKEIYRKHADKIIATKRIVNQYVGCKLKEEDYAELSTLLAAHFRTGDLRKRFDSAFRERLTKQQNGQCAICKAPITSNDAHLDHIIPWDYVGDNLEDNYQMLCETCNERKGTAAYFELSMLLLNKGARQRN